MKKVLYVEASPRKQRSASIEVAGAFLDALRTADADISVDTLDLWTLQLPEFDGEMLAAKYNGLSGTPLSTAQRQAWDGIEALASRLRAADLLVFAVPLWNWSVPYKLKHFIDVVSQKDVLFHFDEQGLRGMLGGKTAVVIYARGLDYAASSITPAEAYDLQQPYMELWLKFIGVSDIRTLTVEKTLFGEEPDRAGRESGKQQARELARSLLRLSGGETRSA